MAETVKFVVHYKNFKKVVPIENLADLKTVINNAFRKAHGFDGKRCLIQYHNKDLNAFVDLDWIEDLHDRGSNKLVLSMIETETAPNFSIESASTKSSTASENDSDDSSR